MLDKLSKNIIKIDNHFWNLHVNLKEHYIHPTYKNYVFAKNRKFINCGNLMENI